MNAQDTHGRLDVLAFRLFEKAAKSDPIASALWDNGLGQAVEAVICEILPDRNVLDLKRALPPPGRRLGCS